MMSHSISSGSSEDDQINFLFLGEIVAPFQMGLIAYVPLKAMGHISCDSKIKSLFSGWGNMSSAFYIYI